MIVPPPAQYYRMTIGLSIYLPSLIPFCSSHAASHSDSTRSIALSDLQLRGTLSGAFDLPTLVNPLTLTRQPGDRDDSAKIYMIPVMKGRMLELEKRHEYALVGTSTITRSASKRFQNLTGIECLKNLRCLLGEYRSSLPPKSQGDPIPHHVQNELWTKASGPANRGHFYGCHTEYFGNNIRSSSGPAYSSSSIDVETIERLQNTVSQLTEELAEQRQRIGGVIPPCPGDAVRAAKGLGPLDDFSTDDDMEDEDEYNDDDY
ncbi:hypothetical protein FXO37_16623 [Capsicum annuum]|nr:hypothetical protein FXO37_16623 [Capsicum annuum]